MAQTATKKKKRFRLFSYVGEIVSELKKVVWLSRREVVYLTGIVILITVIAGVVLGGLDYGFTELIALIIG